MAAAQFTQHFIVNGQYLGAGIRGLDKRPPFPSVPPSLAYFCPYCGEVWARFPVEAVAGSGRYERFQSDVAVCGRCREPHSSRAPGSIWRSFDPEFTSSFPHEALLWELRVLLNFYYPEEVTQP